MRYVVYGAGAVGGVIAANLRLGGADVTVVARGDHLAAIRRDGLRLDTVGGSTHVHVPTAADASAVDWTDDTVVLLCVKSHQTAAALDDLAAHAPPGAPVVCVQNGVANEATALRLFARTYGICVMLPSTHLEPGVVVQKCDPTPGILDIGRFPSGTDVVTDAVAADLRSAGFESVPRADIMAWKHRKLLMNLGNGVDASFAPGSAADELAERALGEGEAVLADAGIAVTSGGEDRARRGDILRRRADLPGPAATGGSTWQSVTRGEPVEVDYLSGEIVLVARLHGLAAPVNEAVQRATADLARSRAGARSLDAADLLARLP
jgi:2-dehydropantoate 2-reductase